MKCSDFMEWVDAKADRGEIPAASNLPEEMAGHLEECESCTEYYADMNAVHSMLLNMKRENEPAELRESLLRLAASSRRGSTAIRVTRIVPVVLKITIPAIVVWLAATFTVPDFLPIVETLLLLIVLVPMFEKMGKKMITDRV